MRMIKLAWQNFRSSFKNYLALVVSLSFTILVFLNFQYLRYSDAFAAMGERNSQYADILIQVISVVLGCFMFFFLWYSTNVFLTRCKKQIGIYIFMGLTNQKIGGLYMIESALTGLAALILGVGFGMLTTQLFQMILLAVSEIAVNISFHFTLKPVLITMVVYLIMYLFFIVKGYVSIVRSSVLDMVSANRQNEYVRTKNGILLLKAVVGLGILFAGYYLAVKDGGQEVLGNVLLAVVLVIAGIYLVFGGFMPLLFQHLAGQKKFLYRRQRTLWVNNVIFRMKKNYRTYAMVSVLMLCAVTALATGFAMKQRYDNIMTFENTYTFQFLSNQDNLYEDAAARIEQENEIAYRSSATMLLLDSSRIETKYQYGKYVLVSYSEIKKLAQEAHLDFKLKEPGDDEIISMSHEILLSLITDTTDITVKINGKEYHQTAETREPYFGYLQENMSYYMVNDSEYQRLSPLGEQLYLYNYKIKNPHNYKASMDELDGLVVNTDGQYTARVAIDPDSDDSAWIKILYSICIFMFLVFILAGGSILFMKIYNDAFEEKERYAVLKKLGFSRSVLKKSIRRELIFLYAMPFLVMTVSGCFSVHALEKMMMADLIWVGVGSVGIIFLLFLCFYAISLSVYRKNANV